MVQRLHFTTHRQITHWYTVQFAKLPSDLRFQEGSKYSVCCMVLLIILAHKPRNIVLHFFVVIIHLWFFASATWWKSRMWRRTMKVGQNRRSQIMQDCIINDRRSQGFRNRQNHVINFWNSIHPCYGICLLPKQVLSPPTQTVGLIIL